MNWTLTHELAEIRRGELRADAARTSLARALRAARRNSKPAEQR